MKHSLLIILSILPIYLLAQPKSVTIEDKPVPKPSIQDSSITSWNQSQPDFTLLSKEAKEFYYWTNYSRKNPRRFWDSVLVPILKTYPNLVSSYSESLKKDLYAQSTLPLLKLNTILIKTAQSHASDICTHHGTPGHTSTDGRTFPDRITAAGIKYCAGENISLGDIDPILSLALLYIDYGLPSLGHRKTLLNQSYVETGVGVALYDSPQTLFIVQDFSCAQ